MRWRKERHDQAHAADDRERPTGEIPPTSAPPHGSLHLDPELLARACHHTVAQALMEDLGADGDLTSLACVPAATYGVANMVARAGGVVAGLAAVTETFSRVDDRIEVRAEVADGDEVGAGAVVARVQGPLRSILTGERTALNLLGHLSGIATTTRAFVDEVSDTGCVVRDTRKTLPGLRLLEKAAVIAGGGVSHRLGLHDALLVKDNHIIAAGGVGAATRSALARAGKRPVQVEVTTLQEVDEAIAAGARDLLMDNVGPEEVRRAVAAVGGGASIEASGGITLANVRAYAEAGANRVAVGALTHSAPWLDVALELDVTAIRAGDRRSRLGVRSDLGARSDLGLPKIATRLPKTATSLPKIATSLPKTATEAGGPDSRSAFSEAATREAGADTAEGQAEASVAKARKEELAPLAPEPDPAGPVPVEEDVREAPLSDLRVGDVEFVRDEEVSASGGGAPLGRDESAG